MRQLEFPENIQAIVGGKEYSLDNACLLYTSIFEELKCCAVSNIPRKISIVNKQILQQLMQISILNASDQSL